MQKGKQKDLYHLPTFSENGYVQAVIEIPAGNNVKYEYRPEKKAFVAGEEQGKARIVEFLPYPSNYGFIPSTLMDRERGGDGDPLDIIVLSERMQRGELIEVVPLGMLRLLDQGERDDKVLAIPLQESRQIVRAERLEDVPRSVLQILEIWFVNYKGAQELESLGWVNEQQAKEAIRKWQIS